MTGYGRGDGIQNGFKVTAELSSVNRKQMEANLCLARELEALESRVRDLIHHEISRGRVVVKVEFQAAENQAAMPVALNEPLARAYVKALRHLAGELNLSDEVTMDQLLRIPGVLRNQADFTEAESFWPVVEKAIKQALSELVKMRAREGEHLLKDLRKRITVMAKSAARIRKHAPMMVKRYQEQLRQRIASAGLEAPELDDERLLKEVVYFADRSDISEELTRLESHFVQFEDCAKAKGPIGRTLDFLAQEINREINTIGSKAQDTAISSEVIKLKAELEKFREQAQNVE